MDFYHILNQLHKFIIVFTNFTFIDMIVVLNQLVIFAATRKCSK